MFIYMYLNRYVHKDAIVATYCQEHRVPYKRVRCLCVKDESVSVRHLAHPGLALTHGFPPFHRLPQPSLPFTKKTKEEDKAATVRGQTHVRWSVGVFCLF